MSFSNEMIILFTVAIEFAFVFLAFSQGKEWLDALIVVNLLLIAVAGAGLAPRFEHITNIGNVFYAAIFLTGQMLAEHDRHGEAYKAIRIGLFSIVVFSFLAPFVAEYSSQVPPTIGSGNFNVLGIVPRIALASAAAFLCSQSINVWLYQWLKRKSSGSHLWFRSAAATTVGQFIDSLIFYPIAFLGAADAPVLEIVVTGFLTKILIGYAGIPILYLSRYLKK